LDFGIESESEGLVGYVGDEVGVEVAVET